MRFEERNIVGITINAVKMSEKFCLRWNDFERSISGSLRDLRDEEDFFDLTVACGEGDEALPAHRVILAACSPLLRQLLRRHQQSPHPLLYLRGVRPADLRSVLAFIYHGEVNVAQEDLNSFLAVAEDLKIKGLTSETSEKKPQPQPATPKVCQRPPAPDPVHQPVSALETEVQEVLPVKTEPVAGGQTGREVGRLEGEEGVEGDWREEYEEQQQYQDPSYQAGDTAAQGELIV